MTATNQSNYENVKAVSKLAGADFSAKDVGQHRFCVLASTDQTAANPEIPGQYGGGSTTITIPAGCAILAGSGVRAYGVIAGKAVAGQPIEVHIGGETPVLLGADMTAGANVSSDANGAAHTASGGDFVLGTINATGHAGDIISMTWQPTGPLT